jgi:hypothetical protein
MIKTDIPTLTTEMETTCTLLDRHRLTPTGNGGLKYAYKR